MTEQVFRYTVTEDKTLEQAVRDFNLHLNHMVLPGGEGFPAHRADATVYMAVIRGRLSIDLDEQETHEYERGTVLKIPQGTKMKGFNRQKDTLELIVVKAFTRRTERNGGEKP
jgi:quercetin dioxygenase-like cupin family protein